MIYFFDSVYYDFDSKMGLYRIGYEFGFESNRQAREIMDILEEVFGDDYIEVDDDEFGRFPGDTLVTINPGGSGGHVIYYSVDFMETADTDTPEIFD